ncbi:helix-turn-helix domain-containing protein [Winogradskya consettensis]|uniref:TetR family transcriptional regulator n=1 Tax=Winogradskya consettensis TaxID=113560 RepID=A0A919SLC0_9ACTN|nr:helix-turn-helix domain-containing protein [Actinoplanes consettensis]GIM73547.1 TetR family transcriptional regulator [Actinoplanes consettensis]
MGRPRTFDEGQAVAAAAELFAGRSFDGTSVDDLVTCTGVHRGSLYKTFGSKRGLYLSALRHHIDGDVTRVAGEISAAPPGQAVERALAGGAGLGFLLLAATERAAADDEVAAEVSRALDVLDQAFQKDEQATALALGLLIRSRADRPLTP